MTRRSKRFFDRACIWAIAFSLGWMLAAIWLAAWDAQR